MVLIFVVFMILNPIYSLTVFMNQDESLFDYVGLCFSYAAESEGVTDRASVAVTTENSNGSESRGSEATDLSDDSSNTIAANRGEDSKTDQKTPKTTAEKRREAHKRFRENIGTTHEHRFINRYKELDVFQGDSETSDDE